MHDPSHPVSGDVRYCSTCGHEIEPRLDYGVRKSASNRIGIAVSILLHLLVVLYYVTRDKPVRPVSKPAREGTMVYIAPLAAPPAASTPAPLPPTVAKAARPRQQAAPVSAAAPRARQEVYVPPVVARTPAPMQPPQPVDMNAGIEARRKLREARQPEAAPQESEDQRATRIARANIAGAQGAERNDSGGGVFGILNQTYHSADINFRGWNGNFKRNWTKQVSVEQGQEPDIETAIIKTMIELIRKEKPGDFVWDSHRLGRQVPLSARIEDTAELHAFLLREFFPDYHRRAR